ncbi:MAG: class I SAM-dependent methyltransferase [Ignavibacteriales bacterium]|nr:class I SAM-dependent methyltransferase [Ignavibacteriales bacterium]
MNNVNFDSDNAAKYDNLARKAVFGYDQLFIMATALISDEQNDSKNVLVVGCGTGMELITFGRLMPNWQMTGVDPSEEMIKISKTKIDEHKLNNRATLHHGFVEGLSEEKKYDAATLIFVMRFIPDDKKKLLLLQNIAKRLRSGAKLILVDQYVDPSQDHFLSMTNAWKSFMKHGGAHSELVNKIAVQANEQSFFTESGMQKLLSETGFGKMNRFYNSFMHSGWVIQKK